MKLVDALVWALTTWDVRYVFGVSGANIEHLHDAVVRAPGALKSVLAKSEVGAAFMADARARAEDTLGVCCATSGGGMMNLAVGIAESYAEHVPVLAIVGQVPASLEGRGGFQDSSGKGRTVDALGLFRSIAKFCERLDDAGAFWETLERAVTETFSGLPGPAVLLIPRDAYELEVSAPPARFPRSLSCIRDDAPLDATEMHQLMDALRVAKRPVIVVGSGGGRTVAREALLELSERARIPVATTMGGPTAFPNDHALYLGCVGAAGHPSAHAYLNEQADLVVAVGTDLGIMTRGPWMKGLASATVIAVGRHGDQVGQNANVKLAVRGTPEDVLLAMLEIYELRPFTHVYDERPLRRYLPELASNALVSPPPPDALLQSDAIGLLEPYMPPQGHVFFDAGNCAAASIHGMRFPRESVGMIALGMGGMGYAFAGAVGAQLGAASGKRTVVLAGDGAFLMLGLEIHTAVELGLPILFVVFNNAKHGMCVTRQNKYFEGRVDCTEYTRIDIAAMSRGMASADRLWVGQAGTRSELATVLADFHGNPFRPGVLELVLAYEEIPPFAPFLSSSAPTYEVALPGRSAVHRAA